MYKRLNGKGINRKIFGRISEDVRDWERKHPHTSYRHELYRLFGEQNQLQRMLEADQAKQRRWTLSALRRAILLAEQYFAFAKTKKTQEHWARSVKKARAEFHELQSAPVKPVERPPCDGCFGAVICRDMRKACHIFARWAGSQPGKRSADIAPRYPSSATYQSLYYDF